MQTLVIVSSAILSLFLAFRLAGSRIRRILFSKMTAVDNLAELGVSRADRQKIKGTAVVCGGSIAGLYAARVCSDHFESVVVIEPEAWVQQPVDSADHSVTARKSSASSRNRVMQYNAYHLYQAFTFQTWRTLFPRSAEAELAKIDGRIKPADPGAHMSGVPFRAPFEHYGGVENTPHTLFVSRPALETTLRRLVRDHCKNITWLVGTVTAVNKSKTMDDKIDSVTYRTSSSDDTTTIDAALVLDCTGAAQAGVKMLERNGWGIAPGKTSLADLKTSYNPMMRYTTIIFHVTQEFLEKSVPSDVLALGGLFMNIPNPAIESRIFGFTLVEKQHIVMVVGGYDQHPKPRTVAELKAFASALRTDKPIPSWIFEFLDALEESFEKKATYEDISVPALNMIPYEKAVNLPSNFVAIGDATMRLNPAGGQGCSKAAISATVLDSLLRRSLKASPYAVPPKFGPTYFAEVAPKINPMWNSTRLRDYAWTTTKPSANETLETGKLIRWYTRNLMPLALKKPETLATLWAVSQFLAPPTDIFSPSIVGKVLLSAASKMFA